jgi:hypothetical protein
MYYYGKVFNLAGVNKKREFLEDNLGREERKRKYRNYDST